MSFSCGYRKVPTVLQMEATECGAAALAMILAYYGRHIPLEQLRLETDVSRDGVNAMSIKHAAEHHCLEGHGYSRNLNSLLKMSAPSIIFWEYNHFVVFEGVKGNCAYINDPAFGRRKLTLKELEEGYSNVVLTFSPKEGFTKTKEKKGWIGDLLQRLDGYGALIFKLFYVGLLLVFPGILIAVLSQFFMDDILGKGFFDWLTRVLVFIALALILKTGLTVYRSLLLQKMECHIQKESVKTFIDHLFSLPIRFFEQRHTGDLVERINNDIEISDFLISDLARTVVNIVSAIMYLIILFLYSPAMTLVGLINIIICIGVLVVCGRYTTNEKIRQQIAEAKLLSTACTGVDIIDTIQASGLEDSYTKKLLDQQASVVALEQKMNRFQQIMGMLPEVVGNIADIAILFIGGYMVIEGNMTMGMLLGFNTMYDMMCQPVNELTSFFSKLQQLKASLHRVTDIYRYPSERKSNSFSKGKEKLEGYIELKHVAFGYSVHKEPIIKDISISIDIGESLAFVGSSGCGKSTVARLIGGLYKPHSGLICFDHIPVEELELERIHSSVSMVSQNTALFSGSIRDNIAMWDRSIPLGEIRRAAADACIDDFISSLPNGYNHDLTENATNLSGGQRQRIEIARALVTNPTILILDEATSALDPITEETIMNNIKRRGCTCVIVAHRLSAIRDCSKIAVVDNGAIVQVGSHEELLKQSKEGNLYYSLVQNM